MLYVDGRWRLLESLFWAIRNDIDAISVIEAVQFWRLVQECEISVGPYPGLTVAEIVLGLGQS